MVHDETADASGGAMAWRSFVDWSPASVFGSTTASVQEPKANVETERRLDNNANKERETEDTTPEDDGEDQDARTEYAARVLQKHGRIWILYRHECESLRAVEALRQQLEWVSAQTIRDWYRRSRLRLAIYQYVSEYRHQRAQEREKEAGVTLVRWLYWQWCIAQARRVLQRRMTARRCLVCWWRRILFMQRCHERRQQLRATERARQAVRIVRRFLSRVIMQRRATRLRAIERVRVFLFNAIVRRRAMRLSSQRRRRRDGARMICRVTLDQRSARQALQRWIETTRHERAVEDSRRLHAACVLQRLVRVVLTAFRLLRRRDAATTIQSLIRMRQAQHRYVRLCQSRQHRAAVHIQRVVRGSIARRRFAELLDHLRERFKCQNCGLVEPGGVYCKFCGRRRTTFDVLDAKAAATSCTTDAKLRKKRRKGRVQEETTLLPPPAPPIASHRPPPRVAPSVLLMMMPDITPQSPRRSLPAVVASPQKATPIRPRKPQDVRAASGRPSIHHRSLSFSTPSRLEPTMGMASVDKTRHRADALCQYEASAQTGAMALHLQRLQKGGKAASR